MPRDVVEVDGPWEHRYVSANGARFHVVASEPSEPTLGTGHRRVPVLFLHGFPQFWWAWRHQLPAVARAGSTAYAMDLRGYGLSDKTPRGYDLLTLSDDVAGVVAALGERRVVLVGHGWGGLVAWTTAARRPDLLAGLVPVAAPHPRTFTGVPPRPSARQLRHLLAVQVPWFPERVIMRGRYVERHLRDWAAPGSAFPQPDVVRRYRDALALWPSPHCALEYHRWLFRSRLRSDGRAHSRSVRPRVSAPVLAVTGADDPSLPRSVADRSARHVAASFDRLDVMGAGHFVPEEQPEALTSGLLDWLGER